MLTTNITFVNKYRMNFINAVLKTFLSVTLATSYISYGHSKENTISQIEVDSVIVKNNTDISYPLIWEKNLIIENHPLIVELVNSPAFQRLQNVDQSGPITYFGTMKFFEKYGHKGPMPKFSRYDHSLAVMHLVKQALGIKDLNQATTEELIVVVSALLHDASHTAFSHLGDHFFAELGKNKNTQQCYQDDVHLDYLKHFEVGKILQKYNIMLEQIRPELHKVLKAPKGALSADKIQYITHTAVILKIFDKSMAKLIISDLIYEKDSDEWYFKTPKLAREFAEASIILTKNIYTAPENYVFYQYFTKDLLEGIKTGLFTLDMFRYGTDDKILQKLITSNNALIKHYLKQLNNIDSIFEIVYDDSLADIRVDNLTFRGIDPKVKMNDKIVELSKIDNNFGKRILELKEWCKRGYGIKFHENEINIIKTLKQQDTKKAA